MAENERLDALAAEQGVTPVTDPAVLRIPGLTEAEARAFWKAVNGDHPSALQAAAVVLAFHDTAWEGLRTTAHLHGWVAARERGLDVPTCDAVVDAALAGVRKRLTEWAEEVTDQCSAVHPVLGARCVRRAGHVDDCPGHYCGDGDESEVWE